MRIGLPELIVLLVLVLLVFGVGKLPEVGTSLGRAVREFKRGLAGESPDDPEAEDRGIGGKA